MADAVKETVQNVVDRTVEATSSEGSQATFLDEVTGEQVSKTERIFLLCFLLRLLYSKSYISKKTAETTRCRSEKG